jgi:hypothetical protein
VTTVNGVSDRIVPLPGLRAGRNPRANIGEPSMRWSALQSPGSWFKRVSLEALWESGAISLSLVYPVAPLIAAPIAIVRPTDCGSTRRSPVLPLRSRGARDVARLVVTEQRRQQLREALR